MSGYEQKRVLVTVKTYPTPASKGAEVSCTAGITDDGKPIYDVLKTWKIRDLDFIPWVDWKPEEKPKSNIFRSRDQDRVWHSWIKNNDGTVERLD